MATQPGRSCLLAALAALVVIPIHASAATTVVTYCGQIFRGRGVLSGDLDCAGFGGSAVIIERGRLDLNGFTISNAGQSGIHCLTTCQIVGPGTITANGLDGIRTEGWVRLRDARVTNNTLDGINARNFSTASRVVASDSLISGNGFNGIESDSSVIVRRSTITASAENGIDVGAEACDTTGRLVLFRSTVSNSGGACAVSDVCADLSACGRNQRAPQVKRLSSCQTSHVRQSGSPGQSWGVCSQD
jgi:hypothetical protein